MCRPFVRLEMYFANDSLSLFNKQWRLQKTPDLVPVRQWLCWRRRQPDGCSDTHTQLYITSQKTALHKFWTSDSTHHPNTCLSVQCCHCQDHLPGWPRTVYPRSSMNCWPLVLLSIILKPFNSLVPTDLTYTVSFLCSFSSISCCLLHVSKQTMNYDLEEINLKACTQMITKQIICPDPGSEPWLIPITAQVKCTVY